MASITYALPYAPTYNKHPSTLPYAKLPQWTYQSLHQDTLHSTNVPLWYVEDHASDTSDGEDNLDDEQRAWLAAVAKGRDAHHMSLLPSSSAEIHARVPGRPRPRAEFTRSLAQLAEHYTRPALVVDQSPQTVKNISMTPQASDRVQPITLEQAQMLAERLAQQQRPNPNSHTAHLSQQAMGTALSKVLTSADSPASATIVHDAAASTSTKVPTRALEIKRRAPRRTVKAIVRPRPKKSPKDEKPPVPSKAVATTVTKVRGMAVFVKSRQSNANADNPAQSAEKAGPLIDKDVPVAANAAKPQGADGTKPSAVPNNVESRQAMAPITNEAKSSTDVQSNDQTAGKDDGVTSASKPAATKSSQDGNSKSEEAAKVESVLEALPKVASQEANVLQTKVAHGTDTAGK